MADSDAFLWYAPPMPHRLTLPLLALLLLPALARADGAPVEPQRRLEEGLTIRLEPGYSAWTLDGPRIADQVPVFERPFVDPLLVQQTENSLGLGLGIGYNIRGHASILLQLRGHGWDLGSSQRGGAGLATLELGWHPAALLEALEVLSPTARRWWDASIHLGAGYGVIGEDRAMDGLVLAFGLRAEAFATDWLSLGAGITWVPLKLSRYVTDWSGGIDHPLPEGSGGHVLFPSLTLGVHAPVGK
ncbi:MAG: hypothetical protein P1V51_08215 [Deltaproteobacteria bacterium]|nr:hypothetical protein [Deltaproteobacteria bacterium]